MEYFGVFQGLLGPFVLISFRSYGGILSVIGIPRALNCSIADSTCKTSMFSRCFLRRSLIIDVLTMHLRIIFHP